MKENRDSFDSSFRSEPADKGMCLKSSTALIRRFMRGTTPSRALLYPRNSLEELQKGLESLNKDLKAQLT